MTTMRNRFDKDNKENNDDETPEERAARVNRLLEASAEWEPEKSAPDDLVARAAARIERERNASLWNRVRYATQPWWSVSAMGLTAATAAVFIIARVNSGPEQAVLYIPRSSDAPRMWQVQPSLIPGEGATPRYQPVALIPEGSARPMMSMPTMSPSGYTTQLAPPEKYTVAIVFEESSAPKRPVVPVRRNVPLAANRAGKYGKGRSPFAHQRKLPTRNSVTKGKEVEELDLPVWQEETVTRQDYRVAVPVMLTPNDSDAGNATGIPAVVELTFEQPTVPLRSTFDE